MTEPLSPAAQAVEDAYFNADGFGYRNGLAAVLRVVANQVVPRPPRNWELISCVSARELEIRNQLLAIISELENING